MCKLSIGSGAGLGLGLLLSLSANAAANEPEVEVGRVVVVRGAGGAKVFKVEHGIVLTARRQRPEAVYVLERAPLGYVAPDDAPALDRRIDATLRRAPF